MKKYLCICLIVVTSVSCSLVKHSPNSGFAKVKYNPHWKTTKKTAGDTPEKVKTKEISNRKEVKGSAEITAEGETVTKPETNKPEPTAKLTKENNEDDFQALVLKNITTASKKLKQQRNKLKPRSTGMAGLEDEKNDDDLANIIWAIIGLLVLFWLIGFLVDWGDLIHLLLVIALVLLIINLLDLL